MKLVLIAVAVIVLAVAGLFGLGTALPKAHTAARSLELHRSPEEVFAILSDFPAYPSWRPDVKSVEVLAPAGGKPRFREAGDQGTLTFDVEEFDPPRRMVTRIADEGLPFGGKWVIEVMPSREGSTITVTEFGEVYNPFFRVISRFVIGHTKTIDAYLANLGRKAA
jgi:uncharacterized protein YndB with AHSA1/START domain